ncbi:olfactory receptor 6M1-like [Candoia aspera]|uniref:olfactory receptor 6M1-like n=1 Tax=Candoia aspera TaxID=51853 RepID=UPI002FD8505F
METQNKTSVTEFVLLGFVFEPIVQIIFFMSFLLIYLVTMLGNVLIIVLICIDRRLQTPMYFFLTNLSFIEMSMTTCLVPKMLANLLSEIKIISFAGCLVQSFFYFFMGSTLFILVAVMAFDRYMAICYPLRYPIMMTGKVCVQMMIGSWIGGLFSVFFSTVLKARLTYCRHNVINHFFCDSAPLLHLACQDITFIELVDFLACLIVLLGSFSFTATSYIYIISTIVKIPSAEGRKKAFGTCASHFTAVSMGYGISIFVYVRPSQSDSMSRNKVLAIFSGILAPFLNPFIFSLRNEQMKKVLRDVLRKMSFKIK